MSCIMEPTTEKIPSQLAFSVEWIDPDTCYQRRFHMIYYTSDKSVELIDTVKKKVFLKRTICYKDISVRNLMIGNQVRIFGRVMTILDYVNATTKAFIDRANETCVIVMDFDQDYFGEIVRKICESRFVFSKMKLFDFNQCVFEDIFKFVGNDFDVTGLESGTKVVMELKAEDLCTKIQECFGSENTVEAKLTSPYSLRAKYPGTKFLTITDPERVKKLLKVLFVKYTVNTCDVVADNGTCCVIKPHAIEEGLLGQIVQKIAENFYIKYAMIFFLNETDASEFCEVYSGVVSDFQAFVFSFLNGPCVVMKLETKNESCNVVEEFRQFCGPFNAEMARRIRPDSLRGMFGHGDGYKNSVHCSDLQDNAEIELEYFFKHFYVESALSVSNLSKFNQTF